MSDYYTYNNINNNNLISISIFFTRFIIRIVERRKEIFAIIPEKQSIAWIWALVFSFAVPEVGTLIRALRICFFRNVRKAAWSEIGLVILLYIN